MSATLTAPHEFHEFELPYTSEDLDEVGGTEQQYQAVLDDELAELVAEMEVVRLATRNLKPPAETGTPAEIDAYLDRVAEELAKLPVIADVLARAAGRDARDGAPIYTPAEVLSWIERCVEMGCTIPRLRGQEVEDVFLLRKVPNARLREAYEQQAPAYQTRQAVDGTGLATVLATAIGAVSNGKPDVTYVRRLLGLDPAPGKGVYPSTLRFFITYEQAVAMADALDLDYHDLGI